MGNISDRAQKLQCKFRQVQNKRWQRVTNHSPREIQEAQEIDGGGGKMSLVDLM